MRNELLSSLAALFVSAGMVLAQDPATPPVPADATNPVAIVEAGPGSTDSRFWASADGLLWWIKDSRLPPLVTTSSLAAGGIIGQGDTRIIFGNGNVDNQTRAGGRFGVGLWLDDRNTFGVEGGYLFLSSRTPSFVAGGNGAPGTPVVARPFFNTSTNLPDAEKVSFPGQLAGTVGVNWTSRLQGAELNGAARLIREDSAHVDVLAGFRYLQLDEGLGIHEDLTVNPALPLGGGSHINVADQFNTRNNFYGGQLGARAEWTFDRLFVNVLGKVALGAAHEVVGNNGTTVITPLGGTPAPGRGGLLAQPSNSGHFSRDQFAVLPEVGINVGYQITQRIRASVGYSFLYLSDLARPGDQIDPRVDSRQIPTAGGTTGTRFSSPAPIFKGTDFWAQGINFGLELRF